MAVVSVFSKTHNVEENTCFLCSASKQIMLGKQPLGDHQVYVALCSIHKNPVKESGP